MTIYKILPWNKWKEMKTVETVEKKRWREKQNDEKKKKKKKQQPKQTNHRSAIILSLYYIRMQTMTPVNRCDLYRVTLLKHNEYKPVLGGLDGIGLESFDCAVTDNMYADRLVGILLGIITIAQSESISMMILEQLIFTMPKLKIEIFNR